MFRSPQPGDWAAEDEDTAPLPSPVSTSPPQDPTPAEAAAAASRSRDARGPSGYDRSNSGGRFDRDRDNGGRFDRNRDNGGRFDGGRFDRDREGGRFDRDGGRYDRDGGRYDRDGGRFDRGGGRFDRDRDYGGDRGYGGDRFDRGGGRFERDGGRVERDGGGRADPARWGHSADRRTDFNDRRGGRDLPVEQGFVVSIKDSFGFVSCMEREGDLFFHISEAPVDVQLQDEVEFRIKYNQRSDKEMACQLVALPKGTIVVEDIGEEFSSGVVTKSLPRRGHGGHSFYNNRDDGRHSQRDDAFGQIEVSKPQECSETDAAEAKANSNEGDAEKQEQNNGVEGEFQKKRLPKRELVRFNNDSMTSNEAKTETEDQEQRSRKSAIPHFGDEVRFRIAKHRKTGVKRAVDITITTSARDKLEKEIEAKLETMTRETGVVDRVKGGGGFIKCCDRPIDVYFPFHEIREPEQSEKGATKDVKPSDTSRGRQGKSTLREGDEVSFYVYEDQEDDSVRSRSRLTALRVQKLPPGSVSFEKLVRADVAGLVSKLPKEPRNGPEVVGAIIPTSAGSDEEKSEAATDTTDESTPEDDAKSQKKKKGGKDSRVKKQKLSFRLCDTEDMSYIPHIDDKVLFDEVLDKRTGKTKAVKVRVLQLNPKNRETGAINAMKDDFGFIKCAERSGDAYFRFSDVMGSSRNFGNGTEVAFDVVVDNKSDHVRASRVQILPRGSVIWEDVAAGGLEGKIVATPSSRRGHHSTRGGRGDKMKQFQKVSLGKISFVTPEKQHLIDFLPELKEKVDSAFVTSQDIAEAPQAKVADDSTSNEDVESKDQESKPEIRVAFPNSLSKFERAALHEYSDWLGLKHESNGEGANRHIELVGDQRIVSKTLESKRASSPPQLTVEFKEDDVEDVRYNPHVGDRVKFDLVLVKRTKQFQCNKISCVEAATAKTKNAGTKSEVPRSEGLIVSVKPEGFGFIQPVGSGAMEENLFFHVNEITTGQTLAELKEGTEVQFTVLVDEKKKRKRAMSIAVVPAGTIKNVAAKHVKGIITNPSFLNRMKGRFAKSAGNKSSTVGKIRLLPGENVADSDIASCDAEADGDDDVEDDVDDEETTEAESDDAEAKVKTSETKKTDKKAAVQKASKKQVYVYNIRDIADQTVVLREGDEVEFIPQITPKNLRAAQIRLLKSHAKQGVVTNVTEDFGGVVSIDSEENEPAIEARFTARNVLRGDILNVGDRVEFAYRAPSAQPSIKNKGVKDKKTSEKAEEKTTNDEAKDESKDGETKNDAEPVLGHATSILRLSPAQPSEGAPSRRATRSVNSTLREAMRQVGANAMVASRMAKGPDGTRGFAEGWNSDATQESASVETTTATTVTTTTTTEQSDA
ncbi:Cold shock domain-containing protein E1 [Phytophthora boehmeriae]|uniref:Cold shock domain-containing protein E1 n=1 Tax=Phytophthora boehmeriae TaxID=109152 RepID=A0A8T1VWH4_9STRA|nr:Cold shock domain-containing protein E1 [Phytophthora boehmeriae]